MAIVIPMNMNMNMNMNTDHVLTLAQWFSPAYPVGAFAYSHGLEWAVDSRDVTDANTLRDWVVTALRYGAGAADALFLAAAFRADDPADTDATARAFAASSERLAESVLLGEAFCRATRGIWDMPIPALTYPVAVGYAAGREQLPLELTLRMYLQAFASNLVTAGLRLIPLGQTEGHRLIRALTPDFAELAEQAVRGSIDDLTSTAFLTDIASMKHETQYSRIFRT